MAILCDMKSYSWWFLNDLFFESVVSVYKDDKVVQSKG